MRARHSGSLVLYWPLLILLVSTVSLSVRWGGGLIIQWHSSCTNCPATKVGAGLTLLGLRIEPAMGKTSELTACFLFSKKQIGSSDWSCQLGFIMARKMSICWNLCKPRRFYDLFFWDLEIQKTERKGNQVSFGWISLTSLLLTRFLRPPLSPAFYVKKGKKNSIFFNIENVFPVLLISILIIKTN